MALVRWDPIGELSSPNNDLNRLFAPFFGRDAAAPRWAPAMDLIEKENHYLVRADLPGLTEDDLEVEIKDGVLTIAGERRSENENESAGYYRLERSFGSFRRSLALPEGIDAQEVSAEFENGVLELRVPKPATRKPHRIRIGSGANDGAAADTVEGEATEK